MHFLETWLLASRWLSIEGCLKWPYLWPMDWQERLRRRLGALAVDTFFRASSYLGALHPRAQPLRHGVERLKNIRYAPGFGPAHCLDVYRPVRLPKGELLPSLLYIHGGGFRILSKDTHWMMGLAFAKEGHVVFVINYRLAPKHPYPAAVEDCALAYEWLTRNAQDWGGDPKRIIVAGESAGANLTMALAIAACFERPEPFAQRVWKTQIVPSAFLPACGIFQVSDPDRFARRVPLPSRFVLDRIEEVSHAYLGHLSHPSMVGSEALTFADPLIFFEKKPSPSRPLPPIMITCGTRDVLLEDSQRLDRALKALGAPVETVFYPGEPHAFHAFIFRDAAQKWWKDTFEFLARVSRKAEGLRP
ncbi:MAG: alpha/beta hydrolase [Deltaproteobacteria bacterium]|nr:alpha/beta hydrolase [Deltaproteobacteria bacterium]